MPYYHGAIVDPSGVLPDGRKFQNIDEFKMLMLADKDQLARALAEKLVGTSLDESTITDAATTAARTAEFSSDLHAGADYRAYLAATLTARALREARDQALFKRGKP